ncbi:CLUMA_CG004752, isoform A [Clunio marinus]|uniref:CLUMA_CG004752, isoform A n=1 Tax=Clunio marinus TaxID=568069 RepID=A0A1J1HSL3_9DIPT|nr:CLUMA_CG004752, isoform A [Clunio marinus]
MRNLKTELGKPSDVNSDHKNFTKLRLLLSKIGDHQSVTEITFKNSSTFSTLDYKALALSILGVLIGYALMLM